MWSKERWESRWRIGVLNPIGWLLAVSFPLIYHFLTRVPVGAAPSPVIPLLHYPHLAFGWFGEDLPELLLVYSLFVAVGSVTREWQSGSIEFLAQLPSTPGRIAWHKGIWGSFEISLVASLSTLVLWAASGIYGHSLPLQTLILSTLVIIMGFDALMWLLSACAWAFHSTYVIILIGLGFYLASAVIRGVPRLRVFSPLTYICNSSPHTPDAILWAHLIIVSAVAAGLALLTVWVAGRQEFIVNHGRDQM